MVYEPKYRWRDGSRFNVNAQTAGEVCQSLEDKGQLSPSRLVDVSRPEDAPLHKAFEWNDETAAEKYREHQARQIIRCIEVVKEDIPDKPSSRVFYNLRADKTASYENVNAIMRNEDKRELLLDQAKSDMKFFKTKYSELNELSKVFDSMDEVLAE